MPRFRTNFMPGAQFLAQGYRQYTGRPTGMFGMRGARETNEALYALAEREQDPEIKDWLMRAIEGGAFEGMKPTEAYRAGLSVVEQRRAERMNLERDREAIQLLASEYGIENLPPEMVEKYALDSETPAGTRHDMLRSEIESRIGRQRTGFEQQETGAAESSAARRGEGLTEGSRAAIRTRAAGVFGRQMGGELAGLRREREGRRERVLGRLTTQLGGTTFRAGGYQSLLGAANRPAAGVIGRRSTRKAARRNYGAVLRGGSYRSRYGGY